jgi:hypothetical protein
MREAFMDTVRYGYRKCYLSTNWRPLDTNVRKMIRQGLIRRVGVPYYWISTIYREPGRTRWGAIFQGIEITNKGEDYYWSEMALQALERI